MATSITLTVSQDLSEQEKNDLRLLVKDALHEFTTKRYPAASYVENRYPDLADQERFDKMAQVDRRIMLGRMMWGAAFDMRIGPTTELDERAPVVTKLRLLERVLAHEVAHHVHGNPPDMATLARLLAEVFS